MRGGGQRCVHNMQSGHLSTELQVICCHLMGQVGINFDDIVIAVSITTCTVNIFGGKDRSFY